jgi:hypothetical protein
MVRNLPLPAYRRASLKYHPDKCGVGTCENEEEKVKPAAGCLSKHHAHVFTAVPWPAGALPARCGVDAEPAYRLHCTPYVSPASSVPVLLLHPVL